MLYRVASSCSIAESFYLAFDGDDADTMLILALMMVAGQQYIVTEGFIDTVQGRLDIMDCQPIEDQG